MRVETAIKMINDHGHKAFVTPEGLTCISVGVTATLDRAAQDIAFVDEDFVFEEVTTFPINDDTMPLFENVDATAIRNWLGY